jgi:NTE family protein
MSLYTNLVLGGGSVRGLAHIGALEKLIQQNLIDMDHIDSVAGSSAGSAISMMIALKYTIDEIWEILYNTDVNDLIKPNIILLLDKFGIENGKGMLGFFEDLIHKKTGNRHTNFKQLYDTTGINLIVVASCLTTKKAVYFNHINTPYIKVSVAVRASISIPCFFTPVTIDGNVYVDGSILDDYPMHLFSDNIDNSIGIILCSEYDTSYQYPEEYFRAIMNLFLYNLYSHNIHSYPDNTIYIDNIDKCINTFTFAVEQDTKTKIRECGYDACQTFINKRNV